jgi:hypothetical protein
MRLTRGHAIIKIKGSPWPFDNEFVLGPKMMKLVQSRAAAKRMVGNRIKLNESGYVKRQLFFRRNRQKEMTS